AEDGIRAYLVTGVQTCALPIFGAAEYAVRSSGQPDWRTAYSAAPIVVDVSWIPFATSTRNSGFFSIATEMSCMYGQSENGLVAPQLQSSSPLTGDRATYSSSQSMPRNSRRCSRKARR